MRVERGVFFAVFITLSTPVLAEFEDHRPGEFSRPSGSGSLGGFGTGNACFIGRPSPTSIPKSPTKEIATEPGVEPPTTDDGTVVCVRPPCIDPKEIKTAPLEDELKPPTGQKPVSKEAVLAALSKVDCKKCHQGEVSINRSASDLSQLVTKGGNPKSGADIWRAFEGPMKGQLKKLSPQDQEALKEWAFGSKVI